MRLSVLSDRASLPLSRRYCSGKVSRVVDPRGFQANIASNFPHLHAPETKSYAQAALKENTLFCGSHGSGKLHILKAAIGMLEGKGWKVAVTSFDQRRAHRMDGLVTQQFLGLRLNSDDLPIQEQMEGTFERHVRLVDSVYEHAIPSIATCDAMVVDSLHLAPPVILASLDAVARRVRGRPGEVFGGMRIIAAADMWLMPVHPGSDTGGYVFQMKNWDAMFPKQVYLERRYHQTAEMQTLTDKALFGRLTAADLQKLQQPPAVASSAAAKLNPQRFPTIVDSARGMLDFAPRFAKQPALITSPPKATQIKRMEIGNFLINMLYQNAFAERYGLLSKLNLSVGSKVHLIFPWKEVQLAAGAMGEVMTVRPQHIGVHFPSIQRTLDVPLMRIVLHHTAYPELTYTTDQFPLFPRDSTTPHAIVEYGNIWGVTIDGRMLADTNDLGNILSRMRSLSDFQAVHLRDALRLEGAIHEPTRVYYCKIRGQPASVGAEQWCKNCKCHIPVDTFFEHWDKCVRSVRWCSECDITVPLSKLEAHREKHQVVLCIDCGRAVEWKHWETHRLTCAPMMREISADNPFLPDVTRRIAVNLGLDKRDLHTVKALSKSMLPKSRKDVTGKY